MDAELVGASGIPSCIDALDAYVTPVALTKASLAGLPVPEWRITDGSFEPPCLVERVGPRPGPALLVRARDEREIDVRRLVGAGADVYCELRLERGSDLVEVRAVRGRTERDEFADWARDVHRVFGLPLMTVRLVRASGATRFAGIGPLPTDSLTPCEREWLGTDGAVP